MGSIHCFAGTFPSCTTSIVGLEKSLTYPIYEKLYYLRNLGKVENLFLDNRDGMGDFGGLFHHGDALTILGLRQLHRSLDVLRIDVFTRHNVFQMHFREM